MFKNITAVLIAVLFYIVFGCYCSKELTPEPPPNIVFIMVDDLGYGDIGCYGNEINRTPNIDGLARDGLRFTDFHSNGPMCSPTRASFLTGMYQYRFGPEFERALDGVSHYGKGLPLEASTIAEILKDAGYATSVFGKWHLGYQPPFLPLNQGFDEFSGLGSGDGDHHTHIDRSGREDWWQGDELKMEEGYSTDLITSHSIDFIKRHRDRPFFLYVSYLAIHFPWQGPEDPPHRLEGIDYHDDKWGIIPDRKNVRPHIKAMVESVDQGVGRITKTLRELDLGGNTLVVFTSDNGGYTDYRGGGFENISSNGPLRGQKTEVYEGGHRVPAIVCWPGHVLAGAESSSLIMSMDMLPTFAELAGVSLPEGTVPDGISITQLLRNNSALPERPVFWKNGENRAIRLGDWKLCLIGEEPPALYNLAEDIGESRNCSADKPELVTMLTEKYLAWEADVTSTYEDQQ
jgi:arylsulfatase A